MSAPAPQTEQVPATLKLARFVVGHRYAVMAALILTTLFFLYPIINAGLTAYGVGLPGPVVRVDTKARALYPDHPFIHAQDKYAKEFGGSQLVAIAVVVKDGTIFTPEVIQKISRITKELDGVGYDSKTKERNQLRDELDEAGDKTPEEIITILDRTYPPYPVNHDQVQSVAARSTRVVQVEADGSINNDVLMKKEPENAAEAEALRELVRQNPPFIFGRLVSRDEKGALIMAGFVSDRLNSREVYEAVFHHVQGIKEREETDNIQIFVSGQPILTGWVLKHAFEIGLFVALTVIATFALLLAYFRRIHGVLIPFIAAITTFIWGLGFTGWWGIYFDPLVLVIPMIITARAVSHTVQMAERFFEDYEIILPMMDNDPEKAKVEAATVAMAELIVPGSLGIVTDFAGLLVILITTIPQLRDLAFFGSFWVLCILATVEILHPVMICFLPPPHSGEHYLPPFMVKLLSAAGRLATGPRSKYAIAGTTLGLLVVSTYITVNYSTIGEARPGSPLLWPEHEFNVATTEIAERFGGVSSLVVYSAGDRANSSADGEPIHRKEDFERWMKTDTNLGATVSLVPFIRGSWQINHYGDPKWYFVPGDTATVRSIIFQLQTNGPPGFLRPYMTDDGKDSNIQFFYPDSKGETIRQAVHAAETFIEANPIGEVDVRLDQQRGDPKASAFSYGRVMDFVYYFLGPLLPTRSHDLNIRLRQEDKSYKALAVNDASKGLPEWIDEFRDAAHESYENAKGSVAEGEFFTWPAYGRRVDQRRRRPLVGGHGARHPRRGGGHRPAAGAGHEVGGQVRRLPADQVVDPRRAVRDVGRRARDPGRHQRGGRARTHRQHLAHPVRDLRAPVDHLRIRLERHHPGDAARHRDHDVPGLHGDEGRGTQHQHAARAVGGRRHRGRLRDLHRRPHQTGDGRLGGPRRGDPALGPHDGHGGQLHGFVHRGRHRPVDVLQPAVPGGDGAAPGDPHGHQHDRGAHVGAGLLRHHPAELRAGRDERARAGEAAAAPRAGDEARARLRLDPRGEARARLRLTPPGCAPARGVR